MEVSKVKIFFDDERLPPDDGTEWVVIRSFMGWNDWFNAYALKWEMEGNRLGWPEDYPRKVYLPNFVSFDHDMGLDYDGKPSKTGFDFAKVLIANDMSGYITFPDDFAWMVHSQNPVGRDNINALLQSYLDFKREWGG